MISISDDFYHPLEVVLRYHAHHYVMVNGESVQTPQDFVSLLIPEKATGSQSCLANLSPRTALNLLAWLQEHKTTLEQLAIKE